MRTTLPLFPEEALPPPATRSEAAPRPQALAHASPRASVVAETLWLGVHLRGSTQLAAESGLERVALALAQFSPQLSLEPPDGLVVEVGASLRLFGGAATLRAAVARRLEALGTETWLALAPTPLAASWLARADGGDVAELAQLPGRLGELPVEVCRWPATQAKLLQELGVRSLADCLRLPRDALSRRSSPALLQSLDRALGRSADPRRAWQPPAGFDDVLALPAETETLARLIEGVDWLIERLGLVLRRRDASVHRLLLSLCHANQATTRVALVLSQPSRDVAHLQALYAQRLERVMLPAPVMMLRLSVPRLELDAAAESGELFARRTPAHPCAGVPQLIERLRARLGVSAVFGLCLVPEHRPENAWQAVNSPGGRINDAALPASAVHRPLWMLAEPVALAGQGGQPHYQGRLRIEQGPERIETGWWDGRDVARDYYIARNPPGMRLWIYRERIGARGWWLHGVFG
ncbi:MAG: DNA polymerase Y family protein [Gammaproteobacteria bacterium]|nr:DNA polymerase Y family protein [Gammaproteobacteria bacterium]